VLTVFQISIEIISEFFLFSLIPGRCQDGCMFGHAKIEILKCMAKTRGINLQIVLQIKFPWQSEDASPVLITSSNAEFLAFSALKVCRITPCLIGALCLFKPELDLLIDNSLRPDR
jgi:hypothetical protein